MAKLEEMKVGEVYASCTGRKRKVIYVDHSGCYLEDIETGHRVCRRNDTILGLTLIKPERELGFLQ